MPKKIKNIFFSITIFIFFYFLFITYFSEQNQNKIIKNRLNITEDLYNSTDSLSVLKNDTQNIIEYKNYVNKSQNKKERNFWKLIDD